MQLSRVDLNNPEKVKIDDGPKSLAYFCRKRPVRVTMELIEKLKGKIAELENRNVRLCLHDGPESNFHDMIILERKGNYYRPHKHKDKGESFHIMEGSIAVFAFDNKGEIIDAVVLEPNSIFVYKVEVNMYHAVMPLSDIVIYHESKLGPFTGAGDNIYPEWSPDGSNVDEVEAYKKVLLNALDIT